MTMKRTTRRRLVSAAVLLALVGAGAAAWSAFGDQDDTAPAGRPHRVRKGELVEVAAASGIIEPHMQVEVKSRSAGEVVEVLVAEGQRVAAGDLLFRLDPTDAERAVQEAKNAQRGVQADLAQARASLVVAQAQERDARTASEVSARGTKMGLVSSETTRTSASAAEVAAANVQLRRAQLAASQAQIAAAQLAVEESERRLAETQIQAPMSGTVLAVALERGSIVSSAVTNVGGGTALATIADLTDLRVIGAIDEAQIGRVQVGHPVTIRVDAYPDRTFIGRVERVSPLGKTVSNVVTFDVEIVVTDPNANLLRSGMSADLEIETSRARDLVLVPLTAIQSVGAQRFVRLANGGRRAVRTGATDGRQIAILEGLQAGETIMIGGLPRPTAPKAGQSIIPMGRKRGSGGGGTGRGGPR
jgi:HlyD family secretion protein